MAEKSRFSDPVQAELPAQCCGRCAHGKSMIDVGQLGRKMVLCKAAPPTPVVMIRNNQPVVVSQWPPMDSLDPGCDVFVARVEQNPSN